MQTESKMTGPRYTQAKEDEKVTESTFEMRQNLVHFENRRLKV